MKSELCSETSTPSAPQPPPPPFYSAAPITPDSSGYIWLFLLLHRGHARARGRRCARCVWRTSRKVYLFYLASLSVSCPDFAAVSPCFHQAVLTLRSGGQTKLCFSTVPCLCFRKSDKHALSLLSSFFFFLFFSLTIKIVPQRIRSLGATSDWHNNLLSLELL